MKLSEHNQNKKFTHCATCGGMLKNTYYTFTDEALQGTVFFELDGSDNVFCDKNCAGEMLGLLKRANPENSQNEKITRCATCGGLLKNTYYTFTEETLQGTVFFELDGSDNVFCDKNCACDMLRLLKKAN